jgi:hypothetical protein
MYKSALVVGTIPDDWLLQYAPAGHALHDACAAVSWYCPSGHFMQADVAAPPLL